LNSNLRHRPLILCYHAIDSSWVSPLSLSEGLFSAHMSELRTRGYVGLTFSESEKRRASGDLPERSVVVTFDDGFASTVRVKPILDYVGFPATVFVVTRFVESGEPLCWPGVDMWTKARPVEMLPLDWTTLAELVDSGWEVGSHTLTHLLLPELDDRDLAAELNLSRTAVAERLGACDTIAYPYGIADSRVAAAARKAGYLAGCTLTPALRTDEPHRRPRIGLAAHDSGWRGWAKLSPTVMRLRRTRLAAALEPFALARRLPPRNADGKRGPADSGPDRQRTLQVEGKSTET
jgi:peptidoglycan/xylan/chitin deacetylase (PgdA/CDA1 family)